MKNTLLPSIEPPTQGSDRILSLRLATSAGPLNVLSIYAPTLCASDESKDEFYEELETRIKEIPVKEELILLGDFNARVGDDHNSWNRCIGHFGIGKMNTNGQRLLELCSYYDFCITNTFFSTKLRHKVSWRHPRSKHWHQLDLIIVRRSSLNNTLVTRTYHSADCDTDHSLVCSKLRLEPKKIYKSKSKKRLRINASNTSIPELCEHFVQAIDAALEDCPSSGVEESWKFVRNAIYKSAIDTFGKVERQNKDWFVAGIAVLEPAVTAKRIALLNYKTCKSTVTLAALRKAQRNVQRIARQCANDYWLNICRGIQLSADCGNTRAMYAGMKKAFAHLSHI